MTFSEDMKHVKSNGEFRVKVGTASADKATNALANAYTHATTLTLDNTAPSAPGTLALASGTASPGNDATPSIEVTVSEAGGTVTLYSDNACANAASAAVDVTDTQTPFKVTVPATALAADGSVTFHAKHTDAATNASACSTASVAYVYDGTDPGIAFPDGVTPTVGTAATITLTDATAKIAKYAVVEVAGTATDATGCDDPSASGDNFSTTAVSPAASPETVSYTPVTATKKICVYAEDAAGNSDSELWGTPIAAADTTGPTVSSIAITSTVPANQNGKYKIGDVIQVTVTFNEAIALTGSPTLKIKVGTAEKSATCAKKGATGDDAKKLECSYTVAEGDEDTDGIAVEAGKLAGTIKDGSNNAATLTYTAISNSASHKVDGVKPTITGFSMRSTGPWYGEGVHMAVRVTFSEHIRLSGASTLAVRIGSNTVQFSRPAGVSGGEDSQNKHYVHTIAAGENDGDGVSVEPGTGITLAPARRSPMMPATR